MSKKELQKKNHRKPKPTVGLEAMRSDRLYKDNDGTLYRKIGAQVEYLSGMDWKPIKVSFDLYQSTKVQEY